MNNSLQAMGLKLVHARNDTRLLHKPGFCADALPRWLVAAFDIRSITRFYWLLNQDHFSEVSENEKLRLGEIFARMNYADTGKLKVLGNIWHWEGEEIIGMTKRVHAQSFLALYSGQDADEFSVGRLFQADGRMLNIPEATPGCVTHHEHPYRFIDLKVRLDFLQQRFGQTSIAMYPRNRMLWERQFSEEMQTCSPEFQAGLHQALIARRAEFEAMLAELLENQQAA